MELKPGYKQTEVGVIPEDWQICQLGEVCTVLRGGSPRPIEDYLTDNANGINWIRIGDVGTGAKYIDSTAERILPSGMSRSRYVKPGDFLLSNSMSFGRPYILRIDGCIHDGWLVIGSYQNSFSSEYLYYCLSSTGVLAQYVRYAAGSSVLNLNKDIVSKVHVAIPGPQEQANISRALGEADQLIEQLEDLIHKKKNIKQAAMQELLTGKRRLPGFEGEWEVKRLGGHVRILRNGVNSRAELQPEGRIRYLHYGDIHASSDSFLSPEQLANLPVTKAAGLDRLQNGDLIFADASEDIAGVSRSVELCEISDYEAVSGLHTIAARFDKAVLADGFKGFLQYIPSFSAHLRRLAAGTKVYATNRAHILSAEVRLPPVAEQQAIAGVLMDMSNEIGVLRERKNKACSTKQGMMQQLLTGKIRLT